MDIKNSQLNNEGESSDAQPVSPGVHDQATLAQEEQKLLQRILQGDLIAMEELYEGNVDRIYRSLLRKTSEKAEAEALTSETFTRALEALMRGKYTWKAPVGAWLGGIAKHVYQEWLRAKSPATSVEELDDEQQLGGGGDVIFDTFWQQESGTSLWKTVARLPLEEQKILRWRFVYGLSYAEISKHLGISPGACKQKNYRAITWLRQNMEASDFGRE